MQFEYQISRSIHDEHQNTITYLEKLETELLKHGHDKAPDLAEGDLGSIIWQLIPLIEEEIGIHFQFEEESIFPILDTAGDSGITFLLTEEHRTILPLGERLMELARGTRNNTLDDETWSELRRLGIELIERLVSHIQKEEMGLLPMIETLIDEEQDAELSNNYAMMR
ncbi:MAG: hemerythrin domain-containing protein [Gammaproteobacteria bacterium]|jgi:hemerythrin-like domain-containing protein|nr:hemerythrin domain-containing protein [Gammaproteobacteria bacterium]